MVRRFNKLQEILDFIVKFHPYIGKTRGVRCLKIWRKPDGTRVPIEDTKGIRIKNFEIFDSTTVIVHTVSHGTVYKEKQLHVLESTLYLPELLMINVYDYGAEFWSNSCIDFSYIQLTREAQIVMLAELNQDVPRVLRAQWYVDDFAETILNEIGTGPKLKFLAPVGRNLDLE